MADNLRWRRRFGIILTGSLMAASSVVMAAPMEVNLEDSVSLALKNNPTVKIAEADKDKANWTISEARAGRMPVVSLNHSDTRSNNANPTNSASVLEYSNRYDNNIKVALPVYSGGRIDGSISQAKYNYKSADLGVDKARQQVKLDATSGFYAILQAQNMVKVNQESVDSLAAHLKNVQAQYEVGTVAKSDVLRSEVELANAQQNLIKAQNTYDLAVSSFNNVIGMPLSTDIQIKEELKYEKYPLSMEESIEYSMKHRPEIGQAKASAGAAKDGIRIAKSGNLPSVTASATMDWYDQDSTGNRASYPGDKNKNWTVSMVATWNVFDAGLTKAKVREADAALVKTEQQNKQTEDGVQLEVRQAYLSMREAEKRIDTSKVAVNKAEEDFKIAQVRYTAGVGTNLDVIDAQVALNQAKTNYIQALYDFNTSKAKLEKAMGVAVK